MRKITMLLASLLTLYLSQAVAEQPALGKYPRLFVAGGYRVTILRIGQDDSSVLIKVDGIDNGLDGQIFLHKKLCDNKRCTNYKYETTEIPGNVRWWTIQSHRQRDDVDSMILYPPGVDKKYALHPDKRPDSFDAKAFYHTYLGQRK